jgi:hypothetical protein
MTNKFKKSAFFFATLPTVILTCFAVWLIPAMYSITFKNQIPGDFTIVEIGLDIFLLLSPLLFMIILVPAYILIYQYWRSSRNLELKIDFGYIEIYRTNTSETVIIRKADIQRIVSIDPGMSNKLFSPFSYLVLFTRDTRIILTCFLTSKRDFFQNFGPYENLADGFPYVPFIEEKKYINVVKAHKFSLTELGDAPIQISGRYLNLLRSLLIPGLALVLFVARIDPILFLTLSILTLIIYFILLTQKRIFINRTELIIKYFGTVRKFPISSIRNISEIKIWGMTTYYLSNPIIKLVVTDSNNNNRIYFFFPRDNAFPELKKLLHLDK